MREFAILPLVLALAGCATSAPQLAAHSDHVEIGYAPGTLGYEAIMHKDWAAAEAQLRAQASADTASLLNLAHVFRMTGRESEAIALYRQVLASEDDTRFELADGRIATGPELAAKAIREQTYASLR